MSELPAKETAKDSASRHIGKHGLAYLVVLVLIGVGSLAFLPAESHAPVIGLISGAAIAIISMLNGITGASDKPAKPDRPEVDIIKDLVARLDKKDPIRVDVDKDKVSVAKGDDANLTSNR